MSFDPSSPHYPPTPATTQRPRLFSPPPIVRNVGFYNPFVAAPTELQNPATPPGPTFTSVAASPSPIPSFPVYQLDEGNEDESDDDNLSFSDGTQFIYNHLNEMI